MAIETKRDGRIINAMTVEIKEVHRRLEAWAKYALGPDGRSWPVTTLLGRVIEQGINGAGQIGPEHIEWPDEVKAVERAVNALGDIDTRVIKAFYGSNNPIEVMARSVGGMPVRQFENVLKRARWRVMGFLDALRSTH